MSKSICLPAPINPPGGIISLAVEDMKYKHTICF